MSDANATQRMEVSGESDGESKFVAETRGHELVMDDPEAMGGDDTGAMPVEYLLAAWTGCLNATVRAVAPDFDLASRASRSRSPASSTPASTSATPKIPGRATRAWKRASTSTSPAASTTTRSRSSPPRSKSGVP